MVVTFKITIYSLILLLLIKENNNYLLKDPTNKTNMMEYCKTFKELLSKIKMTVYVWVPIITINRIGLSLGAIGYDFVWPFTSFVTAKRKKGPHNESAQEIVEILRKTNNNKIKKNGKEENTTETKKEKLVKMILSMFYEQIKHGHTTIMNIQHITCP